MNGTISNLIHTARAKGVELSVRDDGGLVVVAPPRLWQLAELIWRHQDDVVTELIEEGLPKRRAK